MFSQGLADVTAFDTDTLYVAGLTAPRISDITRGFNSLYVYFSTCEHQIIGDAYVPLLRTEFLSGKHDKMINNIYDSPHYVPANTDIIDTIEMDIKNDLNEKHVI